MALRLRRGTDAERLLITPLQGELIYTTDTKLLYVGDGSTAGGTLVTGSGDVGPTTLTELSDTDLTGVADGDVLTYNAGTSKWEPLTVPGVGVLSLNDLSDVSIGTPVARQILSHNGTSFALSSIADAIDPGEYLSVTIVSDDSTIMVDPDRFELAGNLTGDVTGDVTGNLTGDVTGNLTGNATGNHSGSLIGTVIGTLDGDVNGSVFGDDSSVLVDGVNNTIVGVVENDVTASSSYIQGANVRVGGGGNGGLGNIIVLNNNVDSSQLIITTENTSGSVVIPRPLSIGSSSATVADGQLTVVTGTQNSTGFILTGNFDGTGNTISAISRSRGTKAVPTPITDGDGLGSYLLTGYNGAAYRVAGGIKATVAGTPQAAYIPANVEIFVGNSSGAGETVLRVKQSQKVTELLGPMKLVSYADTIARDAAVTAPEAGMVVYLTDTNKAQCYNGTIWNDLF